MVVKRAATHQDDSDGDGDSENLFCSTVIVSSADRSPLLAVHRRRRRLDENSSLSSPPSRNVFPPTTGGDDNGSDHSFSSASSSSVPPTILLASPDSYFSSSEEEWSDDDGGRRRSSSGCCPPEDSGGGDALTIPQSGGDDDDEDWNPKRQRRSSSSLIRLVSSSSDSSLDSPATLVRFFLILCFLTTSASYLRSKSRVGDVRQSMKLTMTATSDAHDRLSVYEWETTLRERDYAALQRRNAELKEETEELFQKRASASQSGSSDSKDDADVDEEDFDDVSEQFQEETFALEKTRTEDEARMLRVAELAGDIQERSQREAVERFGSGPHYVRFKLGFPDADDNPDGASTFVVKLAPLSLMPHSVHLFLETVHRGLWDGCSFNVRAPHLIKASPFGYKSGDGPSKFRSFVNAGLVAPSFPEYSPEYPHKEYTLGFVGNPNAGGFYINTRDNTRVHGPGAQKHHWAGVGGGDPCFGEIVEGWDAVDRMRSADTIDGIAMKRPVEIKSASIVSIRNKKTWRSPPWKK